MKNSLKGFLLNIWKGMAIGVANIVPGLSGSTIALLLNIFERLLQSIRAINIKTLQLFFSGRFREFCYRSDFMFLLSVLIGILLGNVLLAQLLNYLFIYYPIYTWAFFFGLVLVSIFFVSKHVSYWSKSCCVAIFLGIAVALALTAFPLASSNSSAWYLFICGIIAICGMILPGLSGSYILILLGNYQLVMIEGLGTLQMHILGPFLVGVLCGLFSFTHVLAFLLKRYYNQTMAILCGFIAGSLRSLWPWKQEILQDFGTKQKVIGYDYFIPAFDISFYLAIVFLLLGAAIIVFLEAPKDKKSRILDKYKQFS